MTNFDEIDFLNIDGNRVSLGRAFGYLQLFGRLQPFVQESLRYYAIYQEIQTREDLLVTSSEFSQAAIDFRLRAELTDSERFDRWLISQGIDYGIFENQIAIALKLEKLKDRIAEPDLQACFDERKQALDEIELYYIVVAEEALANKIKEQVTTGKSFEQIARDYPLNNEQQVVVKRELLRRDKIREEIKTAIETAIPKQVVGPIAMGERWCLFQVEQVLNAALNDQVKRELRELLFDRWLATKLQQLKIEGANRDSLENGNGAYADSIENAESEMVGVFPNR